MDRLIEENTHRIPWPVTHAWDNSGKRLELSTKPVDWEIVFHADKVEVFGYGPLWARMLFTKKKRALLHDGIEQALETGRLPGHQKAPRQERIQLKKRRIAKVAY